MQEVFGEDVVPVTTLLNEHEEISEIKIADCLKVEVNEARKILYRLYNENLVKFKKKKDMEHGWYTYYWSFNYHLIGNMQNKLQEARLERLSSRLNQEEGTQYYICPNRCIRLNMESSMGYNFKCPECGDLMIHQDNSRTIDNLKSSIEEIMSIMKRCS